MSPNQSVFLLTFRSWKYAEAQVLDENKSRKNVYKVLQPFLNDFCNNYPQLEKNLFWQF